MSNGEFIVTFSTAFVFIISCVIAVLLYLENRELHQTIDRLTEELRAFKIANEKRFWDAIKEKSAAKS